MPPSESFAVFAVAALALLVVPGPAVLYVVARSIDQGRTAGIVSTLGVGAGSLVHVLAAAFGLSALLAASSAAFTIVKLTGAVYLIVLGVRRLVRPECVTMGPGDPPRRSSGPFAREWW